MGEEVSPFLKFVKEIKDRPEGENNGVQEESLEELEENVFQKEV